MQMKRFWSRSREEVCQEKSKSKSNYRINVDGVIGNLAKSQAVTRGAIVRFEEEV